MAEHPCPGWDQPNKALPCRHASKLHASPKPSDAPASPEAAGAKAESAAVAEASNRSAVPGSTAAPGTPAARAAMGARPGPLTAGMSSWGIAPGSSLGAGADPGTLYPVHPSHPVFGDPAELLASLNCFRGPVSPGRQATLALTGAHALLHALLSMDLKYRSCCCPDKENGPDLRKQQHLTSSASDYLPEARRPQPSATISAQQRNACRSYPHCGSCRQKLLWSSGCCQRDAPAADLFASAESFAADAKLCAALVADCRAKVQHTGSENFPDVQSVFATRWGEAF